MQNGPTSPEGSVAAPNGAGHAEGEFLEFVDAENSIMGRAPRHEVHEKGMKHRSVHIAVFDKAGRLYIQKRAASKSVLPGHWDISAAGHVEPDEKYTDAAHRELQEELGITAVLRLVSVSDADERTGNEYAALYVAEANPDDLKPDDREIECGAWVALPELVRGFTPPAQADAEVPGKAASDDTADEVPAGPFTESLVQAVISLLSNGGALPKAAALQWDETAHESLPALQQQGILAWPGVPPHPHTLRAILTEAETGPMPGLERFVTRIIQISLMAAAALAILAFPFNIPEQLLEWSFLSLQQQPDALLPGFVFYQIYPISSSADPLLLKETFVLQILLALIPLALLLFLLKPSTSLLRQPFFVLGALFALWGAISLIVRLSGEGEALFMGAYTLSRVIAWGMLIMLAAVVVRTRRDAWKLLFWLAIPLAIMALGSLEQHVRGTSTIFPKFAFNPRNRMSSSIGHNNGVAGLLMFVWFPVLIGLFWPGRTGKPPIIRRIICGIVFGMILFLVLALQTRGVWIALFATTPPFLCFAKGASGMRLKLKHILLVLLFVILIGGAQTVRIGGNPFVGMVSFAERLADLGPEKLRSTTQRRIFKSAMYYMPKAADRVLLGMGLGSFSYVYPQMQAEFYANTEGEADVLLRPRRTAQAHSDILQIFIETGLVGLLLFCASLFLLARHSERVWRATQDAGGRLMLLAIVFPILATLVHALGDFPFHVASTATVFCIFLGMLIAAPRFLAPVSWQLPMPNQLQRSLSQPRDAGFNVGRFAFCLFILSLFLPSIALMLPNQAYMVGYTYITAAQNRIQRYRVYPELQGTDQGREILIAANEDLKSAIRVFPSEALLYKTRAHLYHQMAHEEYGYMLRLQEQLADPKLIEEVRTAVIAKLGYVLRDAKLARKNGLYYHEVADLSAGAYKLLEDVDPQNREKYMMERLGALKETFYLNPSFAPGVTELLTFYQRYLPNRAVEIAFYRQQLKRFNPDAYFRYYTNRFDIAVYGEQYAEAINILQLLQEDEPDKPEHYFNEAGVWAQWGEVDVARSRFDAAKRRFPDYEYLLDYEIVPALVELDWELIYDITTRLYNRGEETILMPGEIRAARMFAAEKLGKPEAQELREEYDSIIAEGGDAAHNLLKATAEILFLFIGDLKEAAKYADERIVLGKGIDEFHPFIYVISAEYALAQGDLRKVKNRMIEANAIEPNDIRTKRFMARLAQDYPALVDEINVSAKDLRETRARKSF